MNRGSQWNLYSFVGGQALNAKDPSGLTHHFFMEFCCGGKRYTTSSLNPTVGCCNGVVFDPSTECCVNNSVVQKEPIWRCVQNKLFGLGRIPDYTLGWFTAPFGYRARHSYVCCGGANSDCFHGTDSQQTSCSGPYWQPYDPDAVDDQWINFDGSCTKYLVCPEEKKNYIQSRNIPFSGLGPNCAHHAGNCGHGSGWNW